MSAHQIHNKGQARLFKNPFLEALTKTHPLVIWGMYLPIMGGMVYYSIDHFQLTAGAAVALFFAGMFFWTFFEYIMHRFVFHYVSENPRLQRITYVMHGNHHEYPRDKQRLFMPPVPSLIIASLIFLLMYAFIKFNTMAFFPGFILGYLL